MQNQRLVASDGDIISRCRAINKPGSYAILPRANRVTSTLPILKGGVAQVLAAPPLSHHYVAHELVLSSGGGTAKPVDQPLEAFLYVLEGKITLSLGGKSYELLDGGYVWAPPHCAYEFVSRAETCRVLWLRRQYFEAEGTEVPKPIVSNERQVDAHPEDTYMEQYLVPYQDPAFDMGFNLLSFDPGNYFSFVESHIMEHALYLLQGRSIYWLNGDYVEVQKDDFVYMAPYCPQFAIATGWEKMRYLVYKEVNRDYDPI
ncbi:MAG: (S)-ureidoglycine aminohydrolase [Chloroflexi bacterium]|nr:(S)-ureidoglycine aminohydrolase [Chloroflexota bacterium]